jgi:hypothetical protein
MSKNTDPLGMKFSASGVSTGCRQKDTLGTYDIYYITNRRGVNSPRMSLPPKTGFLRSGALEFIFSRAWRG